MLKVLEINGTVEEFMETEVFRKEISEPTKAYYDTVYAKATSELTAEQKKLYDDWWYSHKPVPSDECFWKGVSVPDGYEEYSPLDIRIVHDAILYTACQGCG